VEPDHVLPFQTPSDQLVYAASAAAIATESNGLPKMSCSPVSVTPSAVRWSLPRAASRLPEPVAAACRWLLNGGGVAGAMRPSESSPLPAAHDDQLAEFDGRIAFCWMKLFTSSGVIHGCFCRTRATAPEVMAAASLVPEPRK
jgi:hypothetical protein